MRHEDLIIKLASWAASTPNVRALYLFGSRARGNARLDSDIDLAVDLDTGDGEELAELIQTRASWRHMLSSLTGLTVKDIHLRSDREVSEPVVLVYRRE